MIFLIVIVFIAQLVILVNILTFLIKADKSVLLATDNIEKSRARLKWRMFAIKDITSGLNEIYPKLLIKMERKKRNMIIRTINEVLQSIILLFFKPKYKKMLMGLKIGVGVAKDLLKV